MALDPTVLADGQLPSTKGTLYTAADITIVKLVTYSNTGTDAQAVNLYVDSSGTSRYISPKNMSLGGHYLVEFDQPISLEVGDLLQGDAATALMVDYVVTGAIRP